MKRLLPLLTFVLIPAALQAAPLALQLPANTEVLSEQVTQLDSYALPLGPYADGALPVTQLEGRVQRASWRLGTQGMTSLQVLMPLQDQLTAAGYEILFTCDTLACGGFDFRFEAEVLPAPMMHVDLSDFRFLTARLEGEEHLSLLVSRSANAGFVQMIRVFAEGADTTLIATTSNADQDSTVSRLAPTGIASNGDVHLTVTDLISQGHVVLADLSFETGSADLGAGPFQSLAVLADYLRSDPSRRVALVGHTDAVGALDRNISLSKRRAASVRDRLVSNYGVPSSQLIAEGMGFLAPRAPNLTDDGRQANRRVEAVLLNTE